MTPSPLEEMAPNPEEMEAAPEEMEAPPEPANLMEEPEYWASSDDGEMLAGFCREKVDGYVEVMKTSSFWRNARKNWRYFHNMYTGFKSSGSKSIESMGRDGQLKQISLNHFRELIGHVVDLVTQNRPDFQTEATRDDHDSLKNAELGDAIVNDYMTEGRLEKRFGSTDGLYILPVGLAHRLNNRHGQKRNNGSAGPDARWRFQVL